MSTLTTLARKIKERQKLINRIVKFVSLILPRHGKKTKQEVGSCHIHTIWKLENFANFSFKGDFHQTYMGGNEIYISYFNRVVFHVYYQVSVEECRVERFERGKWLPTFKKLMRNRKAIVTRFNREQRAHLQQFEANTKRQKTHDQLQREADRLQL